MSIADVLSGARRWHIETCRAEELEPRLPDGCVDLILTDPPFHKVKDLAWDREHKTAGGFLDWIGERLAAWRRILAPNGSLYVFASPGMAWGVEGKVREHFSVLNRVTWHKQESTAALRYGPEKFRAYVEKSEQIIFAEQRVDAIVEYLRAECAAAGMTPEQMSGALGFRPTAGSIAPRRYLSVNGFAPMSREDYAKLQALTGRFARPYDALYRPFTVSAAVPYTDVWTYPTVQAYPGKHPCEKPPEMALDIVRASSRPGGLTLDLFGGSFVFSAAAVALGRRAIACDMDPHWCEVGRERCRLAEETGQIVTRARRAPKPGMPPESGPRIRQLDLFSGPA